MKKIIIILLTAFVAAGCEKLDQEPRAQLSKSAVFENEQGLELYANSFYNLLPSASEIMRSPDDAMSDMLARRDVPEFIRPGAFGPQQSSGWTWTDLRNINSFIENLRGSSLPDGVKDNYTGLARFFRAWFYFNKVVRFGDVSWVSKAMDVTDEDLYLGRDSRFTVMDSVRADLDYAIANIQLENDDSRTRITKNIAYALKSRISLFEGTFRKYHDQYGQQGTADEWLQQAADAAQAVMTGAGFSLNQGEAAYRQLFVSRTPVASEVMLVNQYSTEQALLHDANWYWTSATYGVRGSFTRTFINTYLNIDGTPFTDTDGHETALFQEETKGRDLRLAQTIRTQEYGRINGNTFVLSPPLFSYTYTGYQPIKWVLDDSYYDNNAYNDNALPIFRYAEILLNYAEAKAELGTLTDADWDQTIGALRARAGITNRNRPTKADPYLQQHYFPELSDPVLLEVRRERGIELVLEGFRFRDLIRWKKGELLEMTWNGIYVPALNTYLDLNEDGDPDVYFYTGSLEEERKPGVSYIDVSPTIGGGQENPMKLSSGSFGEIIWLDHMPRVWADKHYFYPIPEADRLVNPKLGQNEGW